MTNLIIPRAARRVIAALALALACVPAMRADDTLMMTAEADAFLRSMPVGLQARQESAVRQAIGGDVSALEAVRSSRNSLPDIPEGVRTQDIGEEYRLYTPAASACDGRALPVLIYLHGGGWCFGSINSCAAFCAALVERSGMAVLAVDYPLAPEHPFPAALNAVTKAIAVVAARASELGIDPGAISLGGDSAGGNLALAAALNLVYAREMAAADALPRLKSLVLFYPVVKVWADGSDSWRAYGNGYGLDSGIMEAFNEAYLIGVADARMPLVSPFEAAPSHLKALPPVLMINAGRDILRDQGEAMCRKLAEAGVDVNHKVFEGATHLFITVGGQPTAFARAVDAASDFLMRAGR